MSDVITIGLLSGSCIPQLPKDGSVKIDALLELTISQVCEYYWKAKNYTINTFDISFICNVDFDAFDQNFKGNSSVTGFNPELTQDALCKTQNSLTDAICGNTNADQFNTYVYEELVGEYDFQNTTQSSNNTELNTSGHISIQSESSAGWAQSVAYQIGWQNDIAYCDYTVEPNLYYVIPYIGVNAYFYADVSGATGGIARTTRASHC
jgi:hypothetical protein